MIILFMRLFDLQILKGDEMRRLSEQNRVRVKKILAPRGTIFDRTGKILADTRPSFNLYLIPEDIKDFNQTVDGFVRASRASTGTRSSTSSKTHGTSPLPSR